MQLVILDRDGVINHERHDFVKSPEEWQPLPGSLEAIARATRAGCRVVVATNQSGLARGLFDIDALNAIHLKMQRSVAGIGGAIDAVFFCPHGPDAGCPCRKPEPGLLNEISARLRRPLGGVPAIGDRLADIEAARRAGAKPILVRTGHGQHTLEAGIGLELVPIYDDLAQALDDLLDED